MMRYVVVRSLHRCVTLGTRFTFDLYGAQNIANSFRLQARCPGIWLSKVRVILMADGVGII